MIYGEGARFDPGYSWDAAVQLARQSSYGPYAIARFPDGTFRVYKADAWKAPTGNMLPWSAPPFPAIAMVDAAGTVTVLD